MPALPRAGPSVSCSKRRKASSDSQTSMTWMPPPFSAAVCRIKPCGSSVISRLTWSYWSRETGSCWMKPQAMTPPFRGCRLRARSLSSHGPDEPDPRVEPGVEQVDDEVQQDDRNGDDEEDGADHGQVEGARRARQGAQHEPAEAADAVDRLDVDRGRQR